MSLTLDIPTDLSDDLNAKFDDLGRTAMEALAAEAYVQNVLSLEQVRRLLGLESDGTRKLCRRSSLSLLQWGHGHSARSKSGSLPWPAYQVDDPPTDRTDRADPHGFEKIWRLT
jgi:hypothetical protein